MNHPLDLIGGAHPGPLFVPNKRRANVIAPGLNGAVRRRYERQRTPPWADRKAIAALRRKARYLTALTGVQHVVDHIVPLVGKMGGVVVVSGLHWEGNMRVIEALPNSQKGNGSWPDMPFEQMELLLA